MEKIDAVVMWVDDSDEEWLKEKKKYSPEIKATENNNSARFRDWDNLQYFFRGIEKNASWINNIYFVTWGHVPSWLNLDNPKLKIIKHTDYIPKEYLPTYNSSVIEMNLFRIKELSENFILFNDDMFMLNKTKEEDFFINGLPCDSYTETIMAGSKINDVFSFMVYNIMLFVNKYFDKRKVYKKNFFKYFNLNYGLKSIVSSLLLLPFKEFSFIRVTHLPQPLKKSVMKKLWELEPEAFNTFSLNKFRTADNFNQYLVRNFQLLSGDFVPRKGKLGKYFELVDDNTNIINDIRKNKYKAVCLNDTVNVNDFERSKESINKFLNEVLPDKSSYEK